MHVRTRPGTRIEETARTVDQIEQMIRQVIPANQAKMIVDNMGIPYSGINTSYNNTGTMSAADCDILVSLNENHSPTDQFVQAIRARMPHDFPDVGVWFPPADIVSQTLNFGMPAPIDIQITGADLTDNFNFASKLTQQIRHISGAVDFRIQEPNNVPQLNVTIDRSMASILGITAQSVTQSVLGALSGSEQTSPNFWVDPGNRVSYRVQRSGPAIRYAFSRRSAKPAHPWRSGTRSDSGQCRLDFAQYHHPGRGSLQYRAGDQHLRNADGKDLGYVSDHIQKLVDASRKDLPRGSFIHVRGQVTTMHASYTGLYVGLAFSMVLVYLLMVVNFQSWTEAVHHHHGAALRTHWNHLDALRDGHYVECAGADGCDNVYGSSYGEQRSGGHLRQ